MKITIGVARDAFELEGLIRIWGVVNGGWLVQLN